MLESQRTTDEEEEKPGKEGSLRKSLERFVFASKKDLGVGAGSGGGVDDPLAMMAMPSPREPVEVLTSLRREPSRASSRSWHETQAAVVSQTTRCLRDLGGELFVQTWRERPRDVFNICLCLKRNILTMLFILVSGIVTWESSVSELQARADRSVIFPLYLPHAVALALAAVWKTAIAPGNLAGLYLVRMYMVWRGSIGFTSLNTTVLFLAAFIAVVQSHTGAYFLRKCLCANGVKAVPTIDSVADSVWYLVIIFFISLFYCTTISLCITITPLVEWTSFLRYWSTWWLGVLAAMITVTPLLIHSMAWQCQPSFRKPAKIFECVLVTMVTMGLMVVVFFLNFDSFRPLPYLCFPLITWTAFRFNRVGWAITVSVIAYSGAVGSVHKLGAIYSMTGKPAVYASQFILQIELFSCVMGVVGITLAAAVREKKLLTRKLHQMNVDLEYKVDMRTVELRKANEELQISQKRAEQASHAKSDFLANMSHEIRTPIHGILGLTALLLESELTPDQKESLVSVKECADLLLHIINSVLDLAKIEAGRLEVEKVPFNINKMVSSTLRMMQARARAHGLQLLLEVDRGVPQSLVGDVGKLQQCLLNLVGNALKFTHKGSVSVRVTVATDEQKFYNADDDLCNRVVESFVEKPSAENELQPIFLESLLVQFEVQDTGIGIRKEKLQDMFNPFTQADASTSRLYGGTGLGLCIVQRFVEILGGTIWAESEEGKGSTFFFRLPFLLNSPKESPVDMSPQKMPSGKMNGQPWSLMGGLVFNQTASRLQSELSPQQRTPTLASRIRSANDLVGMFTGYAKDDRVVQKYDFMSPDYDESSKSSRDVTTNGFCNPGWVDKLGSFGSDKELSSFPNRLLGGSLSDTVQQHREQHYSEETLHETATSRRVPMNGDSQNSDKKNWDLELATSSPRENPVDSVSPKGMERETGNGTGLTLDAQGFLPEMVTARTEPLCSQDTPTSLDLRKDLSRKELDKRLETKVHLKILLAEDNAINQKVASRLLQKHGHKVTIVGDGQQALDAVCAQHDTFDLVLMDVQMPIMDGLQATELIRREERERGWVRLPVLGLTAHAIHGYQDTCLSHGMDGYLGKPFDSQQLLKTIGHILPSEKFEQTNRS